MSIKNQISIKLMVVLKKILRLFKPKVIEPSNKFSENNFGIIERLKNINPKSYSDGNELRRFLIKIFGIQVEFPLELNKFIKGIKTIQAKIKHYGVLYDKSSFESYDGLKIPIYIIYPPNFNSKNKYPTIIIFSGHGSAKQAAFEEISYQHASGVFLSKLGFLVYVMENRGMGDLSHLGNHLRIDAVARITGGTWYGEIITDALWLIENLINEPNVDISRIGTAGVSTGGALSMIVSALDKRIAATYIQGYLGSFRKTFGIRGNHCLCGHIPGILKVCDMSDIASLIAPCPVLFVNGKADNFFYEDAKMEFSKIQLTYKNLGVQERSIFLAPENVGHEFSVEIAAEWFSKQLIGNDRNDSNR